MIKAAIEKVLKPSTLAYPYPKTKFRGKVVVDLKKCIASGHCEKACPTGAIKVVLIKGKKKAKCFDRICIHCGECKFVCPVGAITMVSEQGVINE